MRFALVYAFAVAILVAVLSDRDARAGSPLLVGRTERDTLEVWASTRAGGVRDTQRGLKGVLRACGCETAEGWTVLAVRTARIGRLDVRDARGQYHSPGEPCTSMSLQRLMDRIAEGAGSTESWRWFAYWNEDATRATGGRYVTAADTIRLERW